MRQYYTLDNEDMKKLNNGEEVELPIKDSIFEKFSRLRNIIIVKGENFNRDGLHILRETDETLADLPYDFRCWVIKYGCVSVRHKIYKKGSLKRNGPIHIVPLLWNHRHNDPTSVLGYALLDYRDEGVYAYCVLFDISIKDDVIGMIRDRGFVSLSPFVTQVKYDKNFITNGVIQEVSLVMERDDPDESYYPVMKGDE